ASSGIQPVQTAGAAGVSSSAPAAAAVPVLSISGTSLTGARGVLEGSVSDAASIAELRINGRVTQIDSDGRFAVTTFVPIGGADVILEAFNLAGLSTTRTVRLERADSQRTVLSFDQLNPLKRKAARNSDAIALIIGVANYAGAAAPAVYADTDAQVFHDYAVEKLGVPADRIEMLINDAADEKGMLLAVKRWLTRVARGGKSDIYVFFAGHGLATDDGENMYLLPYDGTPELLEKTAILRDELFQDIAATSPRSVTVFLDTCYSGATRGEEMLIAARPIAIRAKEKPIPDGFTLITAAAGDQTAKPLEEARHGMFSYFLMKGLEGDADGNGDNRITAGELHAYVQQNVMQQSSGSQTPTITGDMGRVLVRFQ
ncbi:MAG: caspase family protein, partial [Alphaproteobacteria bacterium]